MLTLPNSIITKNTHYSIYLLTSRFLSQRIVVVNMMDSKWWGGIGKTKKRNKRKEHLGSMYIAGESCFSSY